VKSTSNASATPPEKDSRKASQTQPSDAAINAAIANDPDWVGIEPIDWSTAEVVVPPKKQAISIRLDEDLIGFFKAEGPGYQRRINAVLRGYMRQRQGGR
jgi:uncharacterized protein (DUF4415 family)